MSFVLCSSFRVASFKERKVNSVSKRRPFKAKISLMLALRVDKRGLAIKDIDLPERGAEALVRVLLSGICNTDLEIARGYAGFKRNNRTRIRRHR